MTVATAAPRSVWGTLSLESDDRGRWQIGPLSLWIRRTSSELQVAAAIGEDPFDPRALYEPGCCEEPPADAQRIRCAVGSRGGSVRLVPVLSDRPVVVRPEQPFTLLPEDDATFYVGSQLWVRIEVADHPPQTLAELATFRLSDTWFGPSTREGELCYASRTSARMRLADVPLRPSRALTRIRLRNRAPDKLVLERLKVPVPNLALFAAPDGRHWTQGLVVTREDAGAAVEVRVDPSAPDEAGPVVSVAEPRIPAASVFERTLSALIG